MSMTDPIADLLTRIRNALLISAEKVDIPASRTKEAICRILKEEGYIRNYRRIEPRKKGTLRIFLKYGPNQEQVIHGLRRISKSSLRCYVGKDQIPRVLGGLGVAILSTSRGVMTGENARQTGIGGEVLCYIW